MNFPINDMTPIAPEGGTLLDRMENFQELPVQEAERDEGDGFEELRTEQIVSEGEKSDEVRDEEVEDVVTNDVEINLYLSEEDAELISANEEASEEVLTESIEELVTEVLKEGARIDAGELEIKEKEGKERSKGDVGVSLEDISQPSWFNSQPVGTVECGQNSQRIDEIITELLEGNDTTVSPTPGLDSQKNQSQTHPKSSTTLDKTATQHPALELQLPTIPETIENSTESESEVGLLDLEVAAEAQKLAQ